MVWKFKYLEIWFLHVGILKNSESEKNMIKFIIYGKKVVRMLGESFCIICFSMSVWSFCDKPGYIDLF